METVRRDLTLPSCCLWLFPLHLSIALAIMTVWALLLCTASLSKRRVLLGGSLVNPRPFTYLTDPRPGHHDVKRASGRNYAVPTANLRVPEECQLYAPGSLDSFLLTEVTSTLNDTSYESLTSLSPPCPYILSTTVICWHCISEESDPHSPLERRFDPPPAVDDTSTQIPVTTATARNDHLPSGYRGFPSSSN